MADKTVIGVLASHDDYQVNESLVELLNWIHDTDTNDKPWKSRLEEFQFVFTGGTYERVIEGRDWWRGPRPATKPKKSFRAATQSWLKKECKVTRLPTSREGGVTMLANLIANRQCSILWGLLSPATGHWTNPENLALMRLCDHCRVKRLMNTGSIREWIRTQATQDVFRNKMKFPLPMSFAGPPAAEPKLDVPKELNQSGWEERLKELKDHSASMIEDLWDNDTWGKMTIALIAHDDMKQRMVDFAIDYKPELALFGRILATGTTGKEIMDAVPGLAGKVVRCHSGPKGGDIQIATETILGYCHVVVFFVDPLHPHPHIDDIRVVFGACMARPSVRIITNEIQAREWMETVVRRRRH